MLCNNNKDENNYHIFYKCNNYELTCIREIMVEKMIETINNLDASLRLKDIFRNIYMIDKGKVKANLRINSVNVNQNDLLIKCKNNTLYEFLIGAINVDIIEYIILKINEKKKCYNFFINIAEINYEYCLMMWVKRNELTHNGNNQINNNELLNGNLNLNYGNVNDDIQEEEKQNLQINIDQIMDIEEFDLNDWNEEKEEKEYERIYK